MKKYRINGAVCTIGKAFEGEYSLRGEGSLFDAYNNPSAFKVHVWEDWNLWMRETDAIANMRVHSHNSRYFSILFDVMLIDVRVGVLEVYPTRCVLRPMPFVGRVCENAGMSLEDGFSLVFGSDFERL